MVYNGLCDHLVTKLKIVKKRSTQMSTVSQVDRANRPNPATGLAIQAQNLTKRYGQSRGVTDLNLDVREGEVFGFLGPNGAGKTTSIRMFLNLIKPTEGRV